MSRLQETYVRRVAEAAATVPAFTAARAWEPVPPAQLLRCLSGEVPVWRDGALAVVDMKVAVELPGPREDTKNAKNTRDASGTRGERGLLVLPAEGGSYKY